MKEDPNVIKLMKKDWLKAARHWAIVETIIAAIIIPLAWNGPTTLIIIPIMIIIFIMAGTMSWYMGKNSYTYYAKVYEIIKRTEKLIKEYEKKTGQKLPEQTGRW